MKSFFKYISFFLLICLIGLSIFTISLYEEKKKTETVLSKETEPAVEDLNYLKKEYDLAIEEKNAAVQELLMAKMIPFLCKKRISIDIKHMNVKSRYQYYDLIKKKFNSEVPIIVSHGAVNGMNYRKLPDETGSMEHNDGNNRIDEDFNHATINFYDDEVFRIARSKGIFGIQLDKRRISDKRVSGIGVGRLKSSKLIWKQIEHMGKYLDVLGMPAWDIQCLGTDFDGIIDHLPAFWTAKDLDYLPKFLVKHANEFLLSERGKQLKPKNRITANEIVDKFMRDNA